MLRALKNLIQRLAGISRVQGSGVTGFAATPATKLVRSNQRENQEVMTAVDAFFRRERSYEGRSEMFAALLS